LVESDPTVVIPLHDRVIFVSSFNCAELSCRLSEVAQTFDTVPGFEFLVGGDGLGEAWFPGAV